AAGLLEFYSRELGRTAGGAPALRRNVRRDRAGHRRAAADAGDGDHAPGHRAMVIGGSPRGAGHLRGEPARAAPPGTHEGAEGDLRLFERPRQSGWGVARWMST